MKRRRLQKHSIRDPVRAVEVDLVRESGDRITASLSASRDLAEPYGGGRSCVVGVRFQEFAGEGRGPDFFEALLKLRRQIEPQGWRMLCYGASRDVWPSGMCRDMGSGLKAYRIRPGAQTSRDDLVDVFSTGDDIIPSTVHEQKEYHLVWMESLGARPSVWRRIRRLLGGPKSGRGTDAR